MDAYSQPRENTLYEDEQENCSSPTTYEVSTPKGISGLFAGIASYLRLKMSEMIHTE